MKIFDDEGFIDSEVQDILYELGNVGLGMASITVGKLMGARINLGVPSIVPVDSKLTERFCGQNDKVGILMEFQKTLNGYIIFILQKDFVSQVIKKFNGSGEICTDISDRISAVQEFSNMICAAYLKAVGQYTGIRIYVRPVDLSIEREGTVLKDTLSKFTEEFTRAICVDTGFSIIQENGAAIDHVGHVIMLPDEQSVEKLIEPLCD